MCLDRLCYLGHRVDSRGRLRCYGYRSVNLDKESLVFDLDQPALLLLGQGHCFHLLTFQGMSSI